MHSWAQDAVFYHIFPLGLCGAPRRNSFTGAPTPRLEILTPWLDHACDLGATAILLGPVMESGTHGYDVADYFHVDRRLGDASTLARMASEIHSRGLRLVLDGVFHHVGRDFWAFRDVREKGRGSSYAEWFFPDFNSRSPFNDPFSYQGWNGCLDLVKLNVNHAEVKKHLFDAVAAWIGDYGIDGLRLDAADCLDLGFMRDLCRFCRGLSPDFWLMGEVIHGNYSRWLEDGGLDSVTNYRCYKGLYSSHNDENFFEIAHSIRQQAKEYGSDRSCGLFTFADNHDVERVAGRLADPADLFPLYCLLFTMPGIPALYYGSEFGLKATKGESDDWPLRPALRLGQLQRNQRRLELVRAITRLAKLRARLPALRQGDYRELFVSPRRFVFSRRMPDQWVIVAVSAEKKPVDQEIVAPEAIDGRLVDWLNPDQPYEIRNGRAMIHPLWPCWARVLEVFPKL